MKEFTMKSNTKGLIWFLVIAFAITWASILAIYLLGDVPSSGTGEVSSNPMVGLLSMLGTFGPAIAAFVVVEVAGAEVRLEVGRAAPRPFQLRLRIIEHDAGQRFARSVECNLG